MSDVPRNRTMRMTMAFLCALSIHALILLAVHPESPKPRPMPLDSGIAVTLDVSPPEEPPVTSPERIEEPTPPEPEHVKTQPKAIPIKQATVKSVRKKSKPKPKPKSRPTPTPLSSVVSSTPFSRNAPKVEEAVAGPTISTPLANRKPVYPELARRRGQQGRVLLRATIDERGMLTDLIVQESSGYSMLDSAALKAVRLWRFTPATQAGTSRKGTLLIPVTFILKK